MNTVIFVVLIATIVLFKDVCGTSLFDKIKGQ